MQLVAWSPDESGVAVLAGAALVPPGPLNLTVWMQGVETRLDRLARQLKQHQLEELEERLQYAGLWNGMVNLTPKNWAVQIVGLNHLMWDRLATFNPSTSFPKEVRENLRARSLMADEIEDPFNALVNWTAVVL